ERVRQGQPEWTVVRPTLDDLSANGQKYYLQKDGSFLGQGGNQNKSRLKLTVRTNMQNITAIRLELLTDPSLPLGGPGRSIQKGMCALTEFEVEAASAEAPDKITKVKFAKATADVNPPEAPVEPICDDRSGKRRLSGPVDLGIDGKDETAWGIDVGPGLRSQARKAAFVAGAPIS